MSTRDEILTSLRRNRPVAEELPERRSEAPAAPSDLPALFEERSRQIGSEVFHTGPEELTSFLDERFGSARKTASAAADIRFGDLRIQSDTRVHDLDHIDVIVCRGQLGVAENGAIWITESALGHRAAPYLAEHLVLVLARSGIVDNMEDAYSRIRIDREGYGVFIAGPSKTADIEQTLVVGAQGPTRQTVVLVDD